MMLSIDEVNDYLDAVVETFPEVLFDELNGGVNLLEDTVPDPEFPEGEMYILGEYCDDLLGLYINLYYGSFAALAERGPGDLGGRAADDPVPRADPPHGEPGRAPRPG